MTEFSQANLPPLPQLLDEIDFSVFGMVSPFLGLQLRSMHYGVEEDESRIIGLGLLGMGSRLLNVNNRFLGYANEAVLPFYILHQPIILVIGYFVIPWQVGIPFKYFFIVVTAFITIMLVYEFLVRRTNILRFLFGMKLNKREARKLEEAKAFG